MRRKGEPTGEPAAGDPVLIEGVHRSLGYTLEFKRILGEKGVIKAARRLMDQTLEHYNPPELIIESGPGMMRQACRWNKARGSWEVIRRFDPDRRGERSLDPPQRLAEATGVFFSPGKPERDEETGLEVIALAGEHRRLDGPSSVFVSSYFKVTRGGESFFIKTSFTGKRNLREIGEAGFHEFRRTLEAKWAIQQANLPFRVNVIDAQCGYQDRGQSWFISRWQEIELLGYIPSYYYYENVGGYGIYGARYDNPQELSSSNDQGRYLEEVRRRVERIRDVLRNVGISKGDFDQNCFYNPNTKEYLLLDLGTI